MTCGECHAPAVDPVKPGPAWPRMCRACFARIDAVSEALEMALALAVPLPDPDTGDLGGRRFGWLTVLGPTRRWNRPAWTVRCDCGSTQVLETTALQSRGRSACSACASRENGRSTSQVVGGERIVDLARRAGLSAATVKRRLSRGWAPSRITAPVVAPNAPCRAKTFGGRTVAEIARDAGLKPVSIWSRIREGWPVERLGAPALRAPTRGNARRAA